MANVDVYVQSENVGLLAKTAKANLILNEVYQAASDTLPILYDLKNQHEEFSELAGELEDLLMQKIAQ